MKIRLMTAALLTILPALAAAQVVERRTLNLEGAKIVAAAAAAEARKSGAGGAIAVVDAGGNLLYLERLDHTFAAAANISIGKARSAANFERDTRIFEDAIKNGRLSLVANPELLPLQGGVPVVVDGAVVGAVGVAGAKSAQQDEDIAKAAALAAGAKVSRDVTFLTATSVTSAFAKGMPLLETEGYKIHASRREGPGMAEVHVRDTDIIYVLDGTATVVTGGDVVDGKPLATSADEIRGASITGGKTQHLVKGDLFVVPNGVPHQFTEVTAPFLYYVVKATSNGGGR